MNQLIFTLIFMVGSAFTSLHAQENSWKYSQRQDFISCNDNDFNEGCIPFEGFSKDVRQKVADKQKTIITAHKVKRLSGTILIFVIPRDKFGNLLGCSEAVYAITESGKIIEIKECNDGIYASVYRQTLESGDYSFTFTIDDNVVKETTLKELLDKQKTSIIAYKNKKQPNKYLIVVIPRDKFGSLVGPGYAESINITTPSGDIIKPEDRLDGKYVIPVKINENAPDPEVKIEIKPGETLYEGPIEEILSDKLPVPKERFGISAHAGIFNSPDALNKDFISGLSGTVDFEYRFTQEISLEVLAGYHSFSDNAASDTCFFNLLGNFKYFITSKRFTPFFNGGVGSYFANKDQSSFGSNLGGGFSYQICPKWYIESCYNYHWVFIESKNSNFSNVQVGIRYRF